MLDQAFEISKVSRKPVNRVDNHCVVTTHVIQQLAKGWTVNVFRTYLVREDLLKLLIRQLPVGVLAN